MSTRDTLGKEAFADVVEDESDYSIDSDLLKWVIGTDEGRGALHPPAGFSASDVFSAAIWALVVYGEAEDAFEVVSKAVDDAAANNWFSKDQPQRTDMTQAMPWVNSEWLNSSTKTASADEAGVEVFVGHSGAGGDVTLNLVKDLPRLLREAAEEGCDPGVLATDVTAVSNFGLLAIDAASRGDVQAVAAFTSIAIVPYILLSGERSVARSKVIAKARDLGNHVEDAERRREVGLYLDTLEKAFSPVSKGQEFRPVEYGFPEGPVIVMKAFASCVADGGKVVEEATAKALGGMRIGEAKEVPAGADR